MREPYTCGEATGFRYAAIEPELAGALADWIVAGEVGGGVVLKPGRVWKWREVVIKSFGADASLLARLRASPAVRAADAHFKLRPIASPEPIAALDVRRRGALVQSVLVSRFVAGKPLDHLWRDDERAVRAFPGFLAAMHTRGVFHGDFHTHNSLWNGREWVLLDLESIRHPLRALRRRRIAVEHWAATLAVIGDDARMRGLFDDYCSLAQPRWEVEQAWRDVCELRDALAARWRLTPRYPSG